MTDLEIDDPELAKRAVAVMAKAAELERQREQDYDGARAVASETRDLLEPVARRLTLEEMAANESLRVQAEQSKEEAARIVAEGQRREHEEYEASIIEVIVRAERVPPPETPSDRSRMLFFDRVREAGVPLIVARGAMLLPLEQRASVNELRNTIDPGNLCRLIALSGPPGCGKSVAACLWMARHMPKVSARWINAFDLDELAGYEEAAAMAALRDVDVLVIDDLGVEYLDKNGHLLAALDRIIYQRHGEMLPTVITTNLSAADFKARYGERIARRVNEAGAFVEVPAWKAPNAGESMRGA